MKTKGILKKLTALTLAGAMVSGSSVVVMANEKTYAEPGKEYTVTNPSALPDLPAGYEWNKTGSTLLEEPTCGLPEHIHDSSCYENPAEEEKSSDDESTEFPEENQNSTPQCGYEEHEHNDNCYTRVFTYELVEVSKVEVGFYLCVDRDHSIPGGGESDYTIHYDFMGSAEFDLDQNSKQPIDNGQIKEMIDQKVAEMRESGILYETESIEFARFQYESGDPSYKWHADCRIVTLEETPAPATVDVTCYIWNAETESYEESATVTGLELDADGTPKFDKDAFVDENIRLEENEKLEYELRQEEDGSWGAYFKVVSDNDNTGDDDKDDVPETPTVPADPTTPETPADSVDPETPAEPTVPVGPTEPTVPTDDNKDDSTDPDDTAEPELPADDTDDDDTDDADEGITGNTNNTNGNTTNGNTDGNNTVANNTNGNNAAANNTTVNAPAVAADNAADNVEIDDEPVALAAGDENGIAAVDEELAPASVDIEDEATPLAAAEDGCIIHWIIFLLTLVCGIYHVVRAFFRKRETEEEEADAAQEA